jgi:hypothetical protein
MSATLTEHRYRFEWNPHNPVGALKLRPLEQAVGEALAEWFAECGGSYSLAAPIPPVLPDTAESCERYVLLPDGMNDFLAHSWAEISARHGIRATKVVPPIAPLSG